MRLAVIITARPSYSRIKSAITACVQRGVDVRLVVCASALLERYGRVVNTIQEDFPDVPITEVWSTYEGANLITSAKETGALCAELAGSLSRLRVDYGLVIADRHEVLGAAQAVAYQHIPLIHVQAGERTGSIDDKVRDAITHLADVHCVSTEQAKYRVYGLTGDWANIHQTGCPSIDLAMGLRAQGGSRVVVLQHPVTDEARDAKAQMEMTLEAVAAITREPILFWPGEDAGSDSTAKALRLWQRDWPGATFLRGLPPRAFLEMLCQDCGVLVGNSSVGIRECSYLGLPVVNIGTRQQGRERAQNVVDVPHHELCISGAIQAQLAHGPYPQSRLYGDGQAGERIAEVLCRMP